MEGSSFDGSSSPNLLISDKYIAITNKLRKIWELSDIDKDGHLDLEEFVIAMYLSEISKLGEELPSKLDPSMIPKGKK